MLLCCYYAFVFPILEYCFPVWGPAAECHLQPLMRQVYSVARLCPDQTCHQPNVAALWMLYKINSNSSHYLFSELPSASVRVRHNRAAAAAHPLEFEVSRWGVERPNLQGVFCRLRLVRWMTFPTMCLTLKRYMDLREQSIVDCIPVFVFQFSVVQVLMGLRKQFINNFCSHLGQC